MMLTSLAVLALLAPSAPPEPTEVIDRSGITWIADDWEKAKAQAIEAKQLVAIDVWATWCHSCLSMKNFALKEATLAKVAPKHTWLMLDFDRPENGTFFAKYPIAAIPTFLVIDPKTETVVARWLGSGTATQLAKFFDGADEKSRDPLVLGHRALAKEDFEGAKKIFEKALKDRKLERAAKTKLLIGWIEALWKLDPKACATKGKPYLTETDDTAPGVDFAAMVAGCAEELPEAEKKEVMTAVRDRLAPLVDGPAPDLAVDDRSGVLSTLTDAYEALGDTASAEKVVAARVKLLEDAAAAAKTQAERSTFDAHRLEVYLRTKSYDAAEAMLKASEANQPKDFNHPWRLAVLYLKRGERTADGLAAIDRALANGYGARKLRLFSTKVDLLVQKKAYADARRTIAEAKQEIEKLPKNQVRPSWVKELDSKLANIDKAEKQPS
ncbi:thioredoxin family protein [Myxococcota bacterium]|nr:thioredoxin family protein [Myxococcota bacterium]